MASVTSKDKTRFKHITGVNSFVDDVKRKWGKVQWK